MTDLSHNLDTRTCLRNTETVAGKNLLVTLRMQLREASTELKLLTVDIECTVGTLLALYGIGRQTSRIDT